MMISREDQITIMNECMEDADALTTSSGRRFSMAGFFFQYRINALPVGWRSGKVDPEVEKAEIVEVLEKCNFNISAASRVLKMNRSSLNRRIAKYGIKPL